MTLQRSAVLQKHGWSADKTMKYISRMDHNHCDFLKKTQLKREKESILFGPLLCVDLLRYAETSEGWDPLFRKLYDPYKAEGNPLSLPQLLKNLGAEKAGSSIKGSFFLVDMWWLVKKVCFQASDEFWYWELLYVCVPYLRTEQSLWNVGPHWLEYHLPYVDFKPKDEGRRISCIWNKSRNRCSLQFYSYGSIDQLVKQGKAEQQKPKSNGNKPANGRLIS